MLKVNHIARLAILFWFALGALPGMAANHDDAAQEIPAAASISKKWNGERSMLIEMPRQVALTLKRVGLDAENNLSHHE